MPKNILIKVSGDLVKRKKVIDFIKGKATKNFVVILTGGGSDISFLLKKAGIDFKFTTAGRVIKNFHGRQLARDVLEKKQKMLQNKFIRLSIRAVAEIPVINLGGILCHLNGDNLAEACSVNFDETYVVTRKGRNKKLNGHNLKIIKI